MILPRPLNVQRVPILLGCSLKRHKICLAEQAGNERAVATKGRIWRALPLKHHNP
jgi:hypothetical protein